VTVLPLLRGIVMLAAGALAVLRPDLAPLALGVALLVVSGVEVVLWARLRGPLAGRQDRGRRILRVAAGIVAGLALIVTAYRDIGGESQILAAALVAFALVDAYGAWRATVPGQRSWRAARAAVALATAAILIVIPTVAFAIVIFLGAIAWMVIGSITLAAALDPTIGVGPEGRRPTGLSDLVVTWVRSRDVGADRRVEIVDAYSYETDVHGKLSRFAILLGLSSAIAAAGLLGNSVAAIIGAMIVAPLMGPIIGIAIGIVTGSTARAWRSLQIVLAGIATTVLIGVALGAWLGGPTVTENSEIVGRTAPTLLDLVVALSAGAAGAYAVSNAKVSDSLPGVAIAISLVPPLATVGILLAYGDLAAAAGAGLLFLTNLVSIVVAASVVFVLTGVAPLVDIESRAERTQGWFVGFVALGLVLIIPLAIGTQQALAADADVSAATSTVDGWLEPAPDFEIVDIEIDGASVEVEVRGPGEAPSPEALEAALAADFGRPVSLRLRVIPVVLYSSSPLPDPSS
jgi:uncharacterized hydrophobic protein (TIGR00271 family)